MVRRMSAVTRREIGRGGVDVRMLEDKCIGVAGPADRRGSGFGDGLAAFVDSNGFAPESQCIDKFGQGVLKFFHVDVAFQNLL
jgi:hypothetical protein